MDITDFSNRRIVKTLLSNSPLTQGKLGEKVFGMTNQNYVANTFTNKIFRDDLKFKEVQAACKILGYELHLVEIQEK